MTKPTLSYPDQRSMMDDNPRFFIGTTAIAATSINIICTAATVDASAHTPIGVALRGIRFNPVPGSQE